jgi:hypothetical protein
MHRVAKIRRLDHVVLLVAAQSVLRAESRGDVHAADRAQGVQRMLELGRHRGRVGQQGNAAAFELALQFDVAEQSIDSELDHARALQVENEAVGMVEVWFPGGMFEGQYDSCPARSSMTAVTPSRTAAPFGASQPRSTCAVSTSAPSCMSKEKLGMRPDRSGCMVFAIAAEV